jgi:hypothetical protein
MTVLITLVAVPFLIGVVLAVALAGIMALHFAVDWVQGLRSGSANLHAITASPLPSSR